METRRRRAELGCAGMLFAPIFLIGSLALANASRDSNTTGNEFWSWMLLLVSVTAFSVGGAVWIRNRKPIDLGRK